jgi:hypothetical protein
VAEAKRATGASPSAPAQEERVLAAAVRSVRDAAASAGRPAPPDARVRAFFRAQIEAGKTLQARTLAGPPAEGRGFDLDRELRPALARLGERIAGLVVELPPGTPRDELRRRAAEELAMPGIPDESLRAIADALAELSAP